MFLTPNPIDLTSFKGTSASAGAEYLFIGKVRNHHQGRAVRYLEYEAYGPMAEKQIQKLVDAAQQQWPLIRVAVQHRVGRLAIGDIAIAILTESAHRQESFAANQYLIDHIKHEVPIWKREFYADGTQDWVNCAH